MDFHMQAVIGKLVLPMFQRGMHDLLQAMLRNTS